MSPPNLEWLTFSGLCEYSNVHDLMQQRVLDVINNSKDEAVFLLEHQDVYTAGTGYKDNELIGNNDIPINYTGRGGKFTYHGPGQRIIYPILNLGSSNRSKDLRLYVSLLEQLIINTLNRLGVKAYTIKDKIGVWVDIDARAVHTAPYLPTTNISDTYISGNALGCKIPAKIGAIGVRVKKWVTYHGAAINIKPNLSKFNGIIPCGIDNLPVTSLENIGINVTMDYFDDLLKQEFNKLF